MTQMYSLLGIRVLYMWLHNSPFPVLPKLSGSVLSLFLCNIMRMHIDIYTHLRPLYPFCLHDFTVFNHLDRFHYPTGVIIRTLLRNLDFIKFLLSNFLNGKGLFEILVKKIPNITIEITSCNLDVPQNRSSL